MIPPPRQNRTRYPGVLAPHAQLRSEVVASAGPGEALAAQLREASSRMGLDEEPALPWPESTRAERYAWAMLLARIYELLPLVCPRCGDRATPEPT